MSPLNNSNQNTKHESPHKLWSPTNGISFAQLLKSNISTSSTSDKDASSNSLSNQSLGDNISANMLRDSPPSPAKSTASSSGINDKSFNVWHARASAYSQEYSNKSMNGLEDSPPSIPSRNSSYSSITSANSIRIASSSAVSSPTSGNNSPVHGSRGRFNSRGGKQRGGYGGSKYGGNRSHVHHDKQQAIFPTTDDMKYYIRYHMEYYFSVENLCRDIYLRKHVI